MKMVIYTSRSGRLGNRLKVFAHLIANSMGNHYQLRFPSFFEFAGYFKNIYSNYCCQYPLPSNFICTNLPPNRIPYYYLGLGKILKFYKPLQGKIAIIDIRENYDDKKEVFSLNSKIFYEILENYPEIILKGWSFRDYPAINKFSDSIKPFFQLRDSLSKIIEDYIRIISNRDLLIGIHIRQTDYKYYLNGSYYYDSEMYKKLMLRIEELFPQRRIKFLICSDVDQNQNLFKGLDCEFSKQKPILDMYSLAKCDYIAGPPSSFSSWASFYGNKPLFKILDGRLPEKLEEFKIDDL